MVHTFELNIMINMKKAIKVLTEYYRTDEIYKLLIKLKKAKAPLEIPLRKPGIISAFIVYVSDKYCRFHLRVEPQSLINGRRTIDVFECSHDSVSRLRSTLDGMIESLSNTLPQSNTWILTRIDYAINLSTEYVKECVQLAKKGKDPYYYNDPINKSGSSYRKSKGVILNFYDKFDHMSKKIDPYSADAYLLEEASNIYRIEVQCLNHKKLKHIRIKHNLPDKSNLYRYLRSDIAEWAVTSYYDKVIGREDYYSLAAALKIVESTEWSRRKKKNIKNWLKLIAQAKSVSKARNQFVDGTTLSRTKTVVKGSLNTFRNYEKACRDIGINPVTIPKDWGINFIPNPIKSIDVGGFAEIK